MSKKPLLSAKPIAPLMQTLTPESLAMLSSIAELGSFAAAARKLGLVPSALTYRVRHMEEALDVLLFDRTSRHAVLTPAGHALVTEGRRIMEDLDTVANRVKRVATGWEPQLTIAVGTIISLTTVMELVEQFFALRSPTRIKLRDETLSGTMESLTSGLSDLALGVVPEAGQPPGISTEPLDALEMVFAVAPHHPLAAMPEPLDDELISQYRAVAVADSVQRGRAMSVGLLGGQDVFTVASMHAKLEAQLRGLGCGSVPAFMARPYIAAGRLVEKKIKRIREPHIVRYAWRRDSPMLGRALEWWLQALQSPTTRKALLNPHRGA